MPRKLTTEEFVARVKLVPKHQGKNYEYSQTKYVDFATKVEIVCPTHGPFWQIPHAHMRGSGCPACGGARLTNKSVDDKLCGRNIERVGEIAGAHYKTTWRCLAADCGHEWDTAPTNILSGSGCPKCSNHIKLTNLSVDTRIIGRSLIRVGDINGNSKKVLWRCLVAECSHEWKAVPASILIGYGCPKCANNAKLTNEYVDKRIIFRNISRLEDVSRSQHKIKWKCLAESCQHEWYAVPNKILVGRGCPACAKTGFNPSKPSVVYVYNIGDTYCGYGITNNFKNRDSQHRGAFKKQSVQAKLIASYECLGTEARVIENMLRSNFKVTDTKIAGFRTEATHLWNLPAVLDFIQSQLAESGKQMYNTQQELIERHG